MSTYSGLKETVEAQMAQASFKWALSNCHCSGNVGGKGIRKAAKALTGWRKRVWDQKHLWLSRRRQWCQQGIWGYKNGEQIAAVISRELMWWDYKAGRGSGGVLNNSEFFFFFFISFFNPSHHVLFSSKCPESSEAFEKSPCKTLWAKGDNHKPSYLAASAGEVSGND